MDELLRPCITATYSYFLAPLKIWALAKRFGLEDDADICAHVDAMLHEVAQTDRGLWDHKSDMVKGFASGAATRPLLAFLTDGHSDKWLEKHKDRLGHMRTDTVRYVGSYVPFLGAIVLPWRRPVLKNRKQKDQSENGKHRKQSYGKQVPPK